MYKYKYKKKEKRKKKIFSTVSLECGSPWQKI